MRGGLFMNKNEQVAFQILEDFRTGIKTRKQAALLLGVSERAVTRRARKLRLRGLSGIKHGNYHRKPSNKLSDEIKIKALELIKSSYFDFNIHHAHELLIQQHGFSMSYMTLLGWCKSAGIGNKKRRRPSKARIHRERMSNEGILLQMDGSHHKWNGSNSCRNCVVFCFRDWWVRNGRCLMSFAVNGLMVLTHFFSEFSI